MLRQQDVAKLSDVDLKLIIVELCAVGDAAPRYKPVFWSFAAQVQLVRRQRLGALAALELDLADDGDEEGELVVDLARVIADARAELRHAAVIEAGADREV